MVPVSPGLPGASGGGGAAGPELARVRSALARGVGLEEALNDAAAPATGQVGMARLGQRVRADVDGAGPLLQPLIETDGVTDVLVSGGRTWIDRGHGLEPVPAASMDEPQVRALAVRMAASAHKRLDDACPVVDATLPDGTRLNAVLPPLSADGTLISLRTKRRRAFTLAELTDAGDHLATGARGIRSARTAVHLTDARSESPGESLSRVRMWQATLPRPDLQHEVHIEGQTYRLDFLWPHTKVVGEFDGRIKNAKNTFGKDADDTVRDERHRELALIRAGYDVARWTWKDAWPNDAPTMCRELARHGIHPTGVRW